MEKELYDGAQAHQEQEVSFREGNDKNVLMPSPTPLRSLALASPQQA